MSKLSIGIVGLPNVGKSTLFNALTKKSVDAQNYPFCTIDPSVGIVPVPDERLDALAKLSSSENVIPAVVEFVDIAGLVKGASEGEGLGNKFLANIREVDAILHVVRIFNDQSITHVHGGVDPFDDVSVINLELVLADMQTVTKRFSNVEREAKKGDKEAVLEKELLGKLQTHLDSGKLVSSLEVNEQEQKILKRLHLLTAKPMLYGLNKKIGGENIDELQTDSWRSFKEYLESEKARFVAFDAHTEESLKEASKEEKVELAEELEEMSIDNVIVKGYELLNLITFFTTGEKETRGWTTLWGSTAPIAGTAIHTDFKDKFIRAEVVFFEDLINSGSYAKAREKGLVRTEGKEYVVKDGDVIEYRI